MNTVEEGTERMEELPDKRECYGEQHSKHDMSVVLRNSYQPVIVHEDLLKIACQQSVLDQDQGEAHEAPPLPKEPLVVNSCRGRENTFFAGVTTDKLLVIQLVISHPHS